MSEKLRKRIFSVDAKLFDAYRASMESGEQYRIPTAADIERRAKAMGLSIPDLCKRADISASTFYRWLAGESVIKVDVANRLLEVVQPLPPN